MKISIDLDVFSDNLYQLGFFFSYQQIESLNKPLILLSVILRLKSALNSNLYGYKKTNNGSNQVQNKWQILPPYSEDILNINIHFLKLTWKLEGTYDLKDLSSYQLFIQVSIQLLYFIRSMYFGNKYIMRLMYLLRNRAAMD